jgi:biotin-(acetyl-CoA carboxylase) ligase
MSTLNPHIPITTDVNQRELAMMEKHANVSALQLIDLWIRNTESGLNDLKRYRAQFVESTTNNTTDLSRPVNVLSWTVNQVHNMINNLRTDLAVNRGAELGAVELLKRQLNKGE